MCGIAGILDPRGPREEELRRLGSDMERTLVHRGPDDGGVWVEPSAGIALANRRLAVVGLGPRGHQPMSSSSGRWTITFNGEIYNHAELAKKLALHHVTVTGESDTEALVEAIECLGLERALDACEGMFAFAAWDSGRGQLHLVRDRFGEKPLYYGWVDGRFAFASELKAICVLPGFCSRLDRSAVTAFLRYSCIPAPLSVYEQIAKLLPGEMLTLARDCAPGATPVRTRYWSARDAVDSARADRLEEDDGELVELLRSTLSRSVSDRMLADVPVGAFLSGGVDSSLVVALMQEHSTLPVKTFTVGFAERAYDESVDAARVAAHLGTDHTTLEVSDKEAMDVISLLPSIWDEPFSDSSQIPTLLVSRLARTEVTVSLSGDAGDELFAGYNRHAWLERLLRRCAHVPLPARRALGAAFAALPPDLVDLLGRAEVALPRSWRVRLPATKLAKAAKVVSSEDLEQAYLAVVSHWQSPGELVVGGDPGAPAGWTCDLAGPWPTSGDATEHMLWLDLNGYLPDDILTKLDRGAMSASLETRVPYLDRSVMELAWRLPPSLKLRGGVTKWILREVLNRYVPRPLVERPKMGFGVPLGEWLRGPLRPWAEGLLSTEQLLSAGVLRPEPVRRAWQAHLARRSDLGYELWDVLCLQAWLARWRVS